MRKATDTTFRYLALLQMMPVYPKSLSTEDIRQKLCNDNPDYNVDIRTIQRDLDKLSTIFPISCESKGRANYWFWTDRNALAQIPAMSQSTALALKLAEAHLTAIMPPPTFELLAKYFQHADKVLQESKLGKWSEKTYLIGRGPVLIAPTIKQDVQAAVYAALLEDKQFEVDYQSKKQDNTNRYTLNPLGIVVRNNIVYLVATAWDYQDPRHYVLHRMSHAELLTQRSKPIAGFNLTNYVEQEKEFSYPLSNKKIKLRALFFNGAAIHLTEAKLSIDQKITTKQKNQMLLEATVADTAELRWWLRGFGSSVKVLAPSALQKEFAALTEAMKELYKR